MKRYNLSKIMKEAHQIKKYMKLYSLTHGERIGRTVLNLLGLTKRSVRLMRKR